MKLLDRIVGSAESRTVNQRILNATIFFSGLFMTFVWMGGFFVENP